MRVNTTPAAQRGFTFVELLVALLIFSFAVIGYAALNNRLLASQWAQQQRGLAQQSVNFMVERIKANPVARGCYAVLAEQLVAAEVDPAALQCQAFGTQASQASAVDDVAQWARLLAGEQLVVAEQAVPILAEAVGCVAELEPQRSYRVTVVWASSSGGAAPADCTPQQSAARQYLSESAQLDFAQLVQ